MRLFPEFAKKRACQICGRDIGKFGCIAFFQFEDIISIGPPMGKNVLMDFECYLSYLAQYYEMDNKEIDDYIQWSQN